MSGSKKRRRTASDKSKGRGSAHGEGSFVTLLWGAAIAVGVALVIALVLAVVLAAVGVGGEDPAAKAPIFGLVVLSVASTAAGVVCTRVGHASPLVCVALGAAITAALLLVSLIPAVPEVCLPLPKALCAAIPVACTLIGAVAAAPKQGKRRRKR